MNIFQERLNAIMEEKQISQTELSRRTGITKASISQYVNGIYEAKQNNLFLLAQALGCSPAYLMGIDAPNLATEPARLPDAEAITISNDEKALVLDYRKLNAIGKEKLLDYAADLTENEKYTENLSGKLSEKAIG